MGTIIRAGNRGEGIQPAAFNFEDIAARAEAYLADVRKQAAQIVARAGCEADELRRRAVEEGHSQGRLEVDRLVDEKVAQQMKTVLPALETAVAELRESRQAWLVHWEQATVRLAAAIAARIARRQLSFTPDIPLALVREALELVSGDGEVRVCLSPQDHAGLGSQVATLVEQLSHVVAAQVVADPQVSPGGCRVETRYGVIDQQFEQQLARIEEELS